MAAVKAHFAVPDSEEFVRALGDWADGASAMKIYAAEEVGR